MGSGQRDRRLWRRTGIAFWLAIIAISWSVVQAIASSLLPIHLMLFAAGFVGAFLGSSPLILLPTTARLAFGADASIANPRRRYGALLLLAVGSVTSLVLAVRVFPHESWTGRAISELGVIAALVAGAFSSEFLPAIRHWVSRRLLHLSHVAPGHDRSRRQRGGES
jgi:hypothetical protein